MRRAKARGAGNPPHEGLTQEKPQERERSCPKGQAGPTYQAMAFCRKENVLRQRSRTHRRPHLPGRPSLFAISMMSSGAAVGSSLLQTTPSSI